VTFTGSKTPTGPGSPGVPAPRAGYPRRRSPALMSLGVVLVVLGALGAWKYVGSAAGDTRAYLAVFRPVQQGVQVTRDDLQIVHITPVAGLTPVDADLVNSVVGKYASTTLTPGSLITMDELTSTSSPGPGQGVIGLDLKRPYRPNRAMRPGDHLLLVEVNPNDPNFTQDVQRSGSLATFSGTVAGSSEIFPTGDQVVDVIVATADAPAIAAFASQQQIAIVLVPGSGS
jgi:hypothetical protein